MTKLIKISAALFSILNYSVSSSPAQAPALSQLQALEKNHPLIQAPVSKAAAQAEWTVIAFINGKNDLEAFSLSDVNEMEKIGSTPAVNIVVEMGRMAGYSAGEGDWTGSRRYLIRRDNNQSAITTPILAERKTVDMGDWKYLAEFIKWAKSEYPAKRYALVLWNHGTGWKSAEAEGIEKGISYDFEMKSHISTSQLRQALEAAGKVDLVMMDACLMQMAEVAYEIKNNADYIVTSEEITPMDGHTYDAWLGPLTASPAMPPFELSKLMTDTFIAHYKDRNQGATQSILKASAIAGLPKLIDAWTSEVIKTGEKDKVNIARNSAKAFSQSQDSKDLIHFIQLTDDSLANASVSAAGKALVDYIRGEIVPYNRVNGVKNTNSFGLAVNGADNYVASYDELLWAKESSWDEFLKWQIQ